MEFYTKYSKDVLINMDMSEYYFILVGCCVAVKNYFKNLNTSYPPKDYTELNGILHLVDILYDFQKEYIETPKNYYLTNLELKKQICEALSIFGKWKKEHRQNEIKEHEGNENWGSGLNYNIWDPEDLKEKFINTHI